MTLCKHRHRNNVNNRIQNYHAIQINKETAWIPQKIQRSQRDLYYSLFCWRGASQCYPILYMFSIESLLSSHICSVGYDSEAKWFDSWCLYEIAFGLSWCCHTLDLCSWTKLYWIACEIKHKRPRITRVSHHFAFGRKIKWINDIGIKPVKQTQLFNNDVFLQCGGNF